MLHVPLLVLLIKYHVFHFRTNMKAATTVLLLAGLAMASASALPKAIKTSHTLSYRQTMKAKAIGCDICTIVVTEIDKLIIYGEDSIIDAVKGLCATVDGLFPGAGATCNALVESYLIK